MSQSYNGPADVAEIIDALNQEMKKTLDEKFIDCCLKGDTLRMFTISELRTYMIGAIHYGRLTSIKAINKKMKGENTGNIIKGFEQALQAIADRNGE
jgi:hypothetical protein